MMQKVIWLIDNEILYLQLIERYLHGFGHKVQTFLSSKICLQNIKKIAVEDRPDILIIDCQMPELDGYQLCENIQQISAPEVPFIVMMSSKEPQYEKIKVLASGADYFLPKPIEKENLLQIVQGCLSEVDLLTRACQKEKKYQACLKEAHQRMLEQKTQIKEMHDAVKKLEQLLVILGEKLTFSLLLLNAEGLILEAFGQLKKPLNQFPINLKYKNFLTLCPTLSAFFYQALHGKEIEYEDKSKIHPGRDSFIHYFMPLKNKGYVVYLALDQSEMKRLKQELVQLHGYVNSGRLTQRLIFDFRNILQVINGYTEILQIELQEKKFFSHLQNISRAVDQAKTLTVQMIDHFHKPSNAEEYDANQILEEISIFLQHLLGQNITLKIEIDTSPCWLLFGVGQFTQVITNLILNARDSIGPNDGQISVALSNISANQIERIWPHYKPQQNYAQIVIKDNGCGIEQRYLKSIFEPVYTSEKLPHGVGLGLSTVYRMVVEQGGVIFCESQVGQGTTFTLYLERKKTNSFALGEAANERQYKNVIDRKISVLLADNDHRVCALLKQSLINFGFDVLTCQSYEDALLFIKADGSFFDVIIIDILAYDHHFIAFADKIRTIAPDSFIIYTSSQAQRPPTDALILSDGYFLSKPFHVQELVKVIFHALDISLPGAEMKS